MVDSERLRHELVELLSSIPSLEGRGQFGIEQARWLGKSQQLHDKVMSLSAQVQFTMALSEVDDPQRRHQGVPKVMRMLYTALATVESSLPSSAQGTFLPMGEPFSVLNSIGQVVEQASIELFVVDPYLDAKALDLISARKKNGVSMRLMLDGFRDQCRKSLRTAVDAWNAQYSAASPIEARATPPKALHDRLLIVDKRTVWLISQSLGSLAKNSPASMTQSNADVAEEKIAFYESLWSGSAQL